MMSDDWETPDWIMNIFRHYHDPCPTGAIDYAPDSLHGTWNIPLGGGIFINPPYSQPKPWVEKAIRTRAHFPVTIVMLLKHDSSTQWYKLLHEAGAHFLLFSGRLTYKGKNSRPCAFPSMLAVLS